MQKSAIAGLIVAAFLGGGVIANMDIVAEAASGDTNSVWKKIEARVTELEGRVTALEEGGTADLPLSLEYIVMEDGECAAPDPPFPEVDGFSGYNPENYGWCPDGEKSSFHIELPQITEDSIFIKRYLSVISGVTFTETCTTDVADIGLGGDPRNVLTLRGCSNPPADGSDLRLTIINPK
jgi:hypothetical protein